MMKMTRAICHLSVFLSMHYLSNGKTLEECKKNKDESMQMTVNTFLMYQYIKSNHEIIIIIIKKKHSHNGAKS